MSETNNDKIVLDFEHSNLEEVTQDHPYFSLGQFLLLQQYQKNNSPLFDQQAAKTALFFPDPNWLAWQSHLRSKTENETSDQVEEQAEPVKEIIINEPAPVEEKEELIAFEPLHTVDYFASQGIKLTDAPISNDQLGKQMKSFTEWLKSMKKLHTEKLPGGDEQTDKKIQSIAEASNADTEVVTEAMAEVLVKQGRKDKAIEMYEKLSLLNPSKNAYFATLIQNLSTTEKI